MFNAMFLTDLQNLILLWFNLTFDKNHDINHSFNQLTALVVNSEKKKIWLFLGLYTV